MWREHMTSNSRGPQMVLMVERACHATLTLKFVAATFHAVDGLSATTELFANSRGREWLLRPRPQTIELHSSAIRPTDDENNDTLRDEYGGHKKQAMLSWWTLRIATGANVQYSITRAHVEFVTKGVGVTP